MINTHPHTTGIVSLRTMRDPGSCRPLLPNDNDPQAHAQTRQNREDCSTTTRQYKTVTQTPKSIAGGLQ